MPKAPHAVITGGGRGIGAAVARKFKSEGYRVTVMARSRGDIDRLADEIRAYAVRIDVGDPASVEAAFMAAGPVDVLVNNAAVVRPSEVLETDVRVWEEHLKINLTGSFLCALKVLPGMINRGRGRIVNISSTAGLKGFENLAAYCASKHGLIGFTRALAAEVGDKGVTVNAICPGFVDSPMTTAIVNGIAERTDATAEELLDGFKARSPQGRLFSPEEVADMVFWLAGEQARGINGQNLTLDGGELPM
ncbi:MAG: SDR family NAD(P)-dependent oxidoreductase [Myxococcota bacterium]|nr:SDR family NAD(P)-dependent oxidoreductase [Myxococcota bacterium]